MDVILTILYAVLVLGLLVVIHEAGHYGAARAFGVRVTEFMVGLPGPHVGFMLGETKFGVTAVPLGGYARVCGMEPGAESPHLAKMAEAVFARGTLTMEDAAQMAGITDDEAYAGLDELAEWGSIVGPLRADKYNTYRTRRAVVGGVEYAQGEPQPLADPQAFVDAERTRQYRSLPFWKRAVILLAGPAVNLLFALLVFVVIYSVIGVDVTRASTGETVHVQIDPLRSIQAGFGYIGMVVVSVLGLFNPQTAVDTVSNSASVVGIAVMTKVAADEGLVNLALFTAMISVSLGIMNLLPIPPLDGGRFVVEVFQKVSRRLVGPKALNALSMAGMGLLLIFFLIVVNQDIFRFILGGE